ncbi:Delta-endotoxin CytB, partial [Metarhizium majus ARSEF 297]
MSDQKLIMFDAVSELPESLIPTSVQVMQYTGAYVKIETDKDTKQDKRWFDWNSFKTSIDGYTGADLTFDKYKTTTITRSENTVKTMVDMIVKFLADALNVDMKENDKKALAYTIEATYTNLNEKSSSGFLDFSKSTDGHNSSWEYRIQFAFPAPGSHNYFYSLVTTIKLEADVSDKSEWFGLVSSSSKSFSAMYQGEFTCRK